jgi:hypothetical protein
MLTGHQGRVVAPQTGLAPTTAGVPARPAAAVSDQSAPGRAEPARAQILLTGRA